MSYILNELKANGRETSNPAAESPELDLENPKVRQILDGANKVFLDEGYDAATTDLIARTAGVSKATLYVYFKSKEALLKAMVHRETRSLMPTLWDHMSGPIDIAAVLLRIARTFTNLIMTKSGEGLHRLVIAQASRFPEVGQIFYDAGPRQIRAQVAAILRTATEQGDLEIPDIDMAATQFLSLMMGELPHNRQISLPLPSQTELDAVIASGIKLFLRDYAPKHRE